MDFRTKLLRAFARYQVCEGRSAPEALIHPDDEVLLRGLDLGNVKITTTYRVTRGNCWV